MTVMLQKTAGSDGQNWAFPQKCFYGHRSTASTAKVPPRCKVSGRCEVSGCVAKCSTLSMFGGYNMYMVNYTERD